MIAITPQPPYYAVIFTTARTSVDNGFAEMAEEMEKLVKTQSGLLGFESARNEIGITISYWKDLESIRNWKENLHHTVAREKGREIWYEKYKLRIARVERDYEFDKEKNSEENFNKSDKR